MGNHHGGLDASPLLVGLLGVMAGAVLVAIAHCFIVVWCKDSTGTRSAGTIISTGLPVTQRHVVGAPDSDSTDRGTSSGGTSSGGFSSTVQLVIASSYGGDGKEETCAVCLSEFDRGDEVRVLPGCAHTFHVTCIDRWLVSHRNCPLCRAETPRDLRST